MAEDMSPGVGGLYRLDTDMTVTPVLTGVSVSNGIAWSPDDRTMYYVDSLERAVDVFDFDVELGQLKDRRRLVAIEVEAGMPDGIAIDSAGHLWVALYGGAAVRRYSPAGTLDAVVPLPADRITSCALGGPELRDLYITSATRGASERERRLQPHAGAVFRIRVDVPAAPAARFGG
jgi:sugar lactone lactonase YvrE